MLCNWRRITAILAVLFIIPAAGNFLIASEQKSKKPEAQISIMQSDLADGEKTAIKKQVNIIIGSNVSTVETTKNLVSDILHENNTSLGPLDRVKPDLLEESGNEIRVIRVAKKNLTEQKSIPYTVERQDDEDLYIGDKRVIQKGKNGTEKLTYEQILEDGKEVARNLVQRVVVKEPVKQILAMGTRQTASRGGIQIKFERMIEMRASAYTHTGRNTYTGIQPKLGVVAVDPNVIPLGSRLYIDGYGFATAMDIGGSIRGDRIDLFFETKDDAYRWGVRTVQVFVLSQE